MGKSGLVSFVETSGPNRIKPPAKFCQSIFLFKQTKFKVGGGSVARGRQCIIGQANVAHRPAAIGMRAQLEGREGRRLPPLAESIVWVIYCTCPPHRSTCDQCRYFPSCTRDRP